MGEPFWYSEPSVLFRPTTWYSFVPTASMSVDQSLNAVVRFVIYLSVLLYACSRDARYFLYIPTILIITVALHTFFPKAKKITESFQGSSFVTSYEGTETSQPTPDNPFMNATLPDILDNPNRPPAADVTNKTVRDKVNKSFSQTSNLYMDTSDVFDMMQAQRNFFTVVEDDHGGLLKFLQGNTSSDKIGNESYVAVKGSLPPERLTPTSVSVPQGVSPGSSANT
jgi:hypothetical protein